MSLAEQPGVFDHVIVNDTVEDAYTKLRETIEKVCMVFHSLKNHYSLSLSGLCRVLEFP